MRLKTHNSKLTTAILLSLFLSGIAAAQVETTVDEERFACNGTTKTFTFHFGVWSSSELRVVKYLKSTGAITVLTENSDYTVSLPNGDGWLVPGGTITTTAATAYPSTYALIVSRQPELTQGSHYTTQGSISPKNLQDDFDRQVTLLQYLQRQLNRSIRFAIDANVADAAFSAGKELVTGYVYLDEGKPTLLDIDPNGMSTNPNLVLLSAAGAGSPIVGLLDDANEPEARDTLIAQKRFAIDVTESPYNATGNSVTDDTAAIQAAIDAASAAGGGDVLLPLGTFNISGPKGVQLKTNVRLVGQGAGYQYAYGTHLVQTDDDANAITISGVYYEGAITGMWIATTGTGHAWAVDLKDYTCGDIRIEDVKTIYFDNGIRFGVCISGRVKDCRIYGNRSTATSIGMAFNGAYAGTTMRLEDVYFSGCTWAVDNTTAGVCDLMLTEVIIEDCDNGIKSDQRSIHIWPYNEHVDANNIQVGAAQTVVLGGLTSPSSFTEASNGNFNNLTWLEYGGSLFLGNNGPAGATPTPFSSANTKYITLVGGSNETYSPRMQLWKRNSNIPDGNMIGSFEFWAGQAPYNTPANVARISARAVGTSENAADLEFATATGGVLTKRMTITSTGDVNIPTGSHYKINGVSVGDTNSVTVTLDPNSLAPDANDIETVIFPDTALGDEIVAIPPYSMQGIMCYAYVESAGICKVQFFKPGAGTVNLASGSWVVYQRRH